ncbi:MAG: energy-coupling factor transporter transmembrane protein EcfT [Deltaproteobacteria bacterium]|jgi:energy-coupling factor transport system permease protein|nr:energy-coupling factor transporter transmembrane protein EcfT [Deltaproteobacteria bacterium]
MRASLPNKRKNSFLSRLDVRAKILICLAGSLAVIALSSPLSLGLLVVLTTAPALSAARFATVARVYAFSTLMMIFALGCSALIGLAVPELMRWNAFSLSVPFLRMLVSVNLLLALSLSTPVQDLFARLQAARLPGWVQIPFSVAVRFIPSFIADCAQIRDAARLRPGRGFAGFWRGFAVPLVFRVLYSSDDLAMAAELKGISAAGRARREGLPPLGPPDYAALGLSCCALVAAVALQHFGPQFTSSPM